MAHRKLKPTGKTLFGRPILKSVGPGPLRKEETARIKQTQRELEKLEREQLIKRAEARGRRIRAKKRLADSPFK